MALTLTQVLVRGQALRLYGQLVTDISPRDTLGLPMDPDGPVGFAAVRAFWNGGVTTLLQPCLLLSVYGDGQPPGPDDTGALPGERVWTARLHDTALCLRLQRAPLGSLLALMPAQPDHPGQPLPPSR